MRRKEPTTAANRSEATAVETGLFDEEAVRNARPAVPLERVSGRRAWVLPLVIICLLAAVAGGIAGAVLGTRYPWRSSTQTSAAVQSQTPNATDTKIAETPEQTASSQPTPVLQPVETTETPADSQETLTSENELQAPGETSGKLRQTSSASTADNQSLRRTEGNEAEAARDVGAKAAHASLQSALEEWIAATNARDIKRQMDFYNPTVKAFYLTRNVSRDAVRAEKARVFGQAELINVRAGTPEITFSPDGQTAIMRFRKRYAIEGRGQERRGEVIQELRWRRTDQGWRIISERDLKVIR